MKIRLLAVLSVATLLTPLPALAHQYWIEPNEFFFYEETKEMDDKVKEELSFEVSGGDTYFNADTNRTQDDSEYTMTFLKPDGSKLDSSREFNSPLRRIVESSVEEKGTYTLAVSRTGKPMYYSKLANGSWLPKAKDELSASEKEGLKVAGGYFQHMKSYVTLHTPTDSWQKPLGHALEIVPLSHPNMVYAGNTLKVKVLYNGNPLKNSDVNAIYQGYRAKEHGKYPVSAKTNAEGVASLRFKQASRWLITAKHAEKQADNPKADTIEHQASLMLEVNEPWVGKWTEKY